MKLEYVVKKEDQNLMVRDIVKKKLKVSSRLYRKIVKDIKLNDKECYVSNRVKENDIVSVNLDNAYDENISYDKFTVWEHKLDILYEDEYVLCVNKESGVVCHPTSLHQEKTLYNAVIYYYMKQGLKVPIHFVNRLDRDTTGVVVIAKHKYVQELLVKQMEDGSFNKEYIAIVYGKMENDTGVIERRIKRKENTIILREVTDSLGGDYAKTEYEVLEYNEKENYSVLKVKLYTGRTHQIRVHFSSIGHPLLGDELYVNESNIRVQNIKEYISRQALHAYKIDFFDITGRKVEVLAPLANDMNKVIY